jgi:subtilisin family serine protease
MFDSPNCSLYYDPDAITHLIEYKGDFKGQIENVNYACGAEITESIGLVCVKSNDIEKLRRDVTSIVFFDFRPIQVLQDISPSSVDNINNIKINPYLNLTGKDVLVGIVDTGIDYLNEEFILEDGTSRIVNIWDQTIRRKDTDKRDLYIGETYSNEQINEAIKASKNSRNPYDIVPTKDEIGHGTKVAGVIGARGYNSQFQGVAIDCKFVIVKLMENENFKKQLQVNGVAQVPVYNNTEVATAIEYLKKIFKDLKKPMVILIGVGGTEGSHDGLNLLSRYLTSVGNIRGICLIAGVGNEGAAQGHASGNIEKEGESKIVEINIPKILKYFSMRIWVQMPNRASINVISPTGESSKVINSFLGRKESYHFIFTNTDMEVRYYTPEHFTGHEVIEILFHNIKPGIWRITLIGQYITDGRYNIWLQPSTTLPENTVFLEPDPYSTIVIPSTAQNIISVAYYGNNFNIIATSGKGFSTNGDINPDIATLGVNILTTKALGGVTTISGSSAASAIVAGVSALLLEWGIVKGNDPTMYSNKIRSYLIYGAERNNLYRFPSKEIGFGALDLLGTFDIISRIYRTNID